MDQAHKLQKKGFITEDIKNMKYQGRSFGGKTKSKSHPHFSFEAHPYYITQPQNNME